MNRQSMRFRAAVQAAAIIFVMCSLVQASTAKKELTFADVMKFRQIIDPTLSPDGKWVAFAAQPDRGDGEGVVRSVAGDAVHKVERGSKPAFSKDSAWAAFIVKPRALDVEKGGKEKPKTGMALVRLSDGESVLSEQVERFAFSDDSAWLAALRFPEEARPSEGREEPKKDGKKEKGRTLILRHLVSGKEVGIPQVLSFSFDKSGAYLAYDRLGPEAADNGLYIRLLKEEGFPEKSVAGKPRLRYTNLSWSEQGSFLAFLSGTLDDKDRVGPSMLSLWEARTGRLRIAIEPKELPQGWGIPDKNKLTWTKDGRRLFLGLKPLELFDEREENKEAGPSGEEDLFNVAKILEKREVDVWHVNDPLVNSHQKKEWPKVKDRLYTAVYRLETDRLVALAGKDLPDVEPVENPDWALGLSDVPYLKERTWDGEYFDLYLVSLNDGSRRKVGSRLASSFGYKPSLSPGGRYVVYFDRSHWFLHDGRTNKTVNLTEPLNVPFADEDHDTPGSPPGYGTAGWLENDEAVLINDKFDIWMFPARGGPASMLTAGEGRRQSRVFRVVRTDPEAQFQPKGGPFLLSMFHDREKHHGFYTADAARPGVRRLLEERKKFVFRGKAENADVFLYTQESFDEFPDLWAADARFSAPRKLTLVNPQIEEFAWGTAELVDWRSLDGLPLQGVLIKPAGCEPGKRYPVLIYFYEISSHRLYEYNQTVVNHRPCFPVYASRGYCVFLPDVRFETGRPGLSAFKCVVPGAQKLVDMGVADPEAMALHGHSWGGYETAFLVTQTDMFACAIAGAAVGNMTSAYSGIRWESGMARQMMYEKQQSRIGGSLWERTDMFLANSPVFLADRVKTPLLLMHGDEDGAVPWYQSIEIYLAMRRLGKDCVFLQYRGEPHHPQKYPNKLDYSIKMMEFLDHHLRGLPAPEWMTKGVPYDGR